ncbi:ABC transporter permease [Pelagovum pacificum]|uniref:ABC transporter permease n=1 Tax=Pelagovum pacificum TaxID=2588711 RepID=A0A5C5GBA6_9RHOB|nr:ABC transporter permease [Pelagovum pacificum]QQA42166.1 ABC transporter permease [Pelagovum pacificum]TNY31252.1 ABC transporter permease [Pelagovum pacificum]
MTPLEFILAGTLAAATPLLLAALGELVVEKSGVLNLGVEGMMALAAAVSFIVAYETGNHLLAFLAGGVASMAAALVFALPVLSFRANQVAAGLAVGILAGGLSALVGRSYESLTVTALPKFSIPLLTELPVIGGVFRQDIVVWLSVALAFAMAWTFKRTRLGWTIRSVGENPNAAHAIGTSVLGLRLACIAFGGLLAGFGGAYASTVYTPLWADGMIAGRGWIAVALVVFGTWQTGRVAAGAILFGALSLGELVVQATGVNIPSQLLAALPYLATIIVLGLISSNRQRLRMYSVASLGEPFRR